MAYATAIACLLAVSLLNQRGFETPISLDLHGRNPFAWMLLVSLAVLIALLSAQLRRHGHVIRPILLILVIPALIVIACTSPFSLLHGMVFHLLFVGSLLWFVFCTADVLDDFIGGVFFVIISLIGLLIISPLFGLGGMQKILIAYALGCIHIIQSRTAPATSVEVEYQRLNV